MANAGCINAYDCNGCLIQTLQNLDSACIGVGVQYTAPNPLDDKRLDYIKYTDKCGCVQCLSAENEILIYATNGVIKNLTLTNDDVNEAIKIQWNDIFGSNRAKTIVRYKTGSYPVSITDGTLAVEETTKNQYSSTPFSLSGVLDETTYYISAFAVDSNGTIIDVQGMSITTDFYKLKFITDFRNYSSLAQLQAVGWTNEFRMSSQYGSIGIGYGSTGLKLYNSGYGGIYATLPFEINGNHIIYGKITGNGNTNTAVYMNISNKTLPDLSVNDSREAVARAPFSQRKDFGLGFNKSVGSTKYWAVCRVGDTELNGVNGNVNIEFEINLKENIIKYRIIEPSSLARELTGTLNSDGRTCIIGGKYLLIWFANYASATNYIYTCELKIK